MLISSPPTPAAVERAIERAIRRLAPLWPLAHFVAVNPFLGVADRPLRDAARHMARASGAQVLMPLSCYANAVAKGRIALEDIAEARAEAGPLCSLPLDPAAISRLAEEGEEAPAARQLPCVAAIADQIIGDAWEATVTERLSAWAAGYFDQGQAVWPSPWRELPPFQAWRTEASLDRTAEALGLPHFRKTIRELPETPEEAIPAALERLEVPESGLDAYFDRLFATIGGWAAFARQRLWERELSGETDGTLQALLAARLGWEVALLEGLGGQGVATEWAKARRMLSVNEVEMVSQTLGLKLLLQAAYEKAWQRQLAERLERQDTAAISASLPAVQAVFCIDVRSEVFRRALEAETPEIETLGFAGFFGFPVAFQALGEPEQTPHCPVLLSPQFTVGDACDHRAHEHPGEAAVTARHERASWKAFRRSAISSFAFVETLGLTYAVHLAADGFASAFNRTFKKAKAQPDLPPLDLAAIPLSARIDLAEGALRGMSLTERFARLVLLAGHGATTVNNPHARGLDCGACGGHSGAPNARLAAAVLNDPPVRDGLAARGIAIPDETVFVAGLHDTTTDKLTLLDTDDLPLHHAEDLRRLRCWLAGAGRRCRAERAAGLGIEGAGDIDTAVTARSRDWSQVRPEWGLAGCAAFIAAPRVRTAGADLGGRCFLHSYDWRNDQEFKVLELILTAPVIVASWISLQYYGSVVDNRVFGSGNKVLHNVVGGLGVLEGNSGDLRGGLPWQSVHDGQDFVHEPMRLSVVVEAPRDPIAAIVQRHPMLRDLVANGWIHLLAMDEEGRISHRYVGADGWTAFRAEAVSRPVLLPVS